MFARAFKTLFSQSSYYPFLSRNPHFSFSFSLLFSSQTSQNSNAISEYFVREHQFPSELAVKAASSLSHLKTPEKCYEVLSFFKAFGFSNSDLQNMVNRISGPRILCAKVDKTLKPKIKTFQDFGFSNQDIVCILTANSWSLLSSANNRILSSLSVLKNVLGSVDLVAKLLKRNSWFIKNDLKKTLVPNIEFLKNCGIHSEQLTRHMFISTRLFLRTLENLKKSVEIVDDMGCNRESKMYIYAINSVSTMSEVAWAKKLELFRSFGFTKDQIFYMFGKQPLTFAVSPGKIKEVMQVISGSQMYDLSHVVLHPRVFNCSIDRRIKPRLTVLKILGNANLIPRYPGFSAVHWMTDDKFIKTFVTPFLHELRGIDCQLLKKANSGSHV